MKTETGHPKWWQVYLTFPLLIILFVLDHRLRLSTRGHQIVQIGIILLVYGLIHLWLKVNAQALSTLERQQFHSTSVVMKTPAYRLDNLENETHPVLKLSNSEITGTLSDTFEMEIIDAEFVAVEEFAQELNKE